MLTADDLQFDQNHIWHPYTSMTHPQKMFAVKQAQGCKLTLADDSQVIDGMASWWSAIHGYNHPTLNNAIAEQTQKMAHVMFGGLTHQAAIDLCKTLIEITPSDLDKVFLADSGSISVEVAMKMALQYWMGKQQPQKNQFLSLRHGYHGDTFASMSVSDPENGMHHLFTQNLMQQLHANAPQANFDQQPEQSELDYYQQLFAQNHEKIAAMIIEPIVQGAGGMRIYSPEYVKHFRKLCDQYNVLLICDEIATGFGRTGEIFAVNHANICPDILCVGKSLTGGYMTLAATLCTNEVAKSVCESEAGVFMHGPTFMGNPLACAVANASIKLLLSRPWQEEIKNLQHIMQQELSSAQKYKEVADVRTLGGIGVIELQEPVEMKTIQPLFVKNGVWVRPFGKLVYIMPPFVISDAELEQLCQGILATLDDYFELNT